METIKLVIKYKEKYICEKNRNYIDFIHVPQYYDQEPFSNISIFITLLLSNIIDNEFNAAVSLNECDWREKFETSFVPEYLYQIDDNTFIYDMDKWITDIENYKNKTNIDFPIPSISTLPERLIDTSLEKQKDTKEEEDEISYSYHAPIIINKELLKLKSTLKICFTNVLWG